MGWRPIGSCHRHDPARGSGGMLLHSRKCVSRDFWGKLRPFWAVFLVNKNRWFSFNKAVKNLLLSFTLTSLHTRLQMSQF